MCRRGSGKVRTRIGRGRSRTRTWNSSSRHGTMDSCCGDDSFVIPRNAFGTTIARRGMPAAQWGEFGNSYAGTVTCEGRGTGWSGRGRLPAAPVSAAYANRTSMRSAEWGAIKNICSCSAEDKAPTWMPSPTGRWIGATNELLQTWMRPSMDPRMPKRTPTDVRTPSSPRDAA